MITILIVTFIILMIELWISAEYSENHTRTDELVAKHNSMLKQMETAKIIMKKDKKVLKKLAKPVVKSKKGKKNVN